MTHPVPDTAAQPGRRDVVVILGCGPRLGAALARAFAALPATVVLVARDAARLSALAASIAQPVTGSAASSSSGGAGTGATIDVVPADVSVEAELRAAFATIRSRHGDPTVLIHNPSHALEAPPTQITVADLLEGVRLAAGSLLVAAQEVAPAMRTAGRGTILITGSITADTGSTWSASLGVQKAAVRNLALSLAAELGDDGICVTTVTICGVLDEPGLEPARIAEEYVRIHRHADDPRGPRSPEVRWTRDGPRPS